MAYVITSACIGVCAAACAKVCPVDCIDGPMPRVRMFIDPSSCTSCGACAPELPEEWKEDRQLNANFFATGVRR
jgi:ferredoxin